MLAEEPSVLSPILNRKIMSMSNFIDEAERHAELYGRYSDRQRDVLEQIKSLKNTTINDEQLARILHGQGINDIEIAWLKRNGHVLPVYP